MILYILWIYYFQIILDLFILYKSFGIHQLPTDLNTLKSINLHPTLATICALQILYNLYFLCTESDFIATFEFQYEGLGFYYFLYDLTGPLLYASIPKYIFDYRVNLFTWQLVSAAVLYLIGFVLFVASNAQKNAFRRNPYSPSLSRK